jgi:hypothetical protein
MVSESILLKTEKSVPANEWENEVFSIDIPANLPQSVLGDKVRQAYYVRVTADLGKQAKRHPVSKVPVAIFRKEASESLKPPQAEATVIMKESVIEVNREKHRSKPLEPFPGYKQSRVRAVQLSRI